MHYYPPWLDYAAWIVGAAGVVSFIKMAPEPSGRKRGFLKLGACLLVAIGAGFGATGGVLFNSRAPWLTATGKVFGVYRTTGKNSSTTFDLEMPAEAIYNLHLHSAIKQIEAGEIASVQYQGTSNAVLNINILQGRYAGYQVTGNDGMVGSVFLLIAAFVLSGYAVLDWFNDGKGGTTDDSETPDPDSAPASGVDAGSMLNLSPRDQ